MSTTDRINILCISPFFVPVSDPEAFCGGKLIKALLDQGADITVLWSSNYKKRAMLDDSCLWEPLRSISVDVPAPPRAARIVALPSALRYRTRFASRWVKSVVSKAVAMGSKKPFDLVYSRSLPMFAHVAGYWCARHLNVPWVVNVNDPWDSQRSPLPSQRPSRLERFNSEYWLRKTVKSADLITFPSKALAAVHGVATNNKVKILPHVACVAADNVGTEKNTSSLFNLVHAGRLSAEEDGRSTRSLMIALAQFLSRTPRARPTTRLTLVGTEDRETKDLGTELGLQDLIRFVGRVSYENSLREISKATVCLLVEAPVSKGIFLPSKLVDYIAARKPILALSPRAGVAADMAATGELLRVDPDDPSAIQAAIATLYSDFRRGTLQSRAPREVIVREFDPQVVAVRFLEAARGILRASPLKLKTEATMSRSKTKAPTAGVHA